MLMNRRDFVRFLGITAAGAAALPEQIEAFTAYYDANTPETGEPLVAVDDIFVCGNAACSTLVTATFFIGTLVEKPVAFNAFGGIIRWTAAPDQKIVLRRSDVSWKMTANTVGSFADVLVAHISYIDQAKVRRTLPLLDWNGSL
jgi:hypothetical protein